MGSGRTVPVGLAVSVNIRDILVGNLNIGFASELGPDIGLMVEEGIGIAAETDIHSAGGSAADRSAVDLEFGIGIVVDNSVGAAVSDEGLHSRKALRYLQIIRL